MALPDNVRNLYGPTRLGDLTLVLIRAVMTAGAPVIDAASSSPGVTIALGTAGQFTGTFPAGSTAFWLNVMVDRNAEAAGVGQSVHAEGLSAAGTFAFETTTETADTPFTPTDGSVLYIAILVGAA